MSATQPPSKSKRLRPLLILGGAVLVIFALSMLSNTPEDRPQQDMAPLVRVVPATPSPYRFTVRANGSVSPRTESELISQVEGEITEMSPALVAGGFFAEGDLLARIDSADYRVDREAARAQVARAESEHRRAKKELDRQGRLADRSVSSESRIDDAENNYRIAEASLREAQARLERAERDLARTEIRAPYRGRVRSEQVDVGQFVSRGNPIATIYAVDFAEIRLPIPDRELAFLDIPLVPDATREQSEAAYYGARVRLNAEFAGAHHEWEGRLVRSEAELDARSRMIYLVARVPDPFGLETPRTAPLAIGLFVEAEIEGQAIPEAFLLPRDALRPGEQVYVVDKEGQIDFRDIELLRTERDQIVVAGGLKPGERVCTSALDAAIDGMHVRVADPLGQSTTEGLAETRELPGATAGEPAEAIQ